MKTLILLIALAGTPLAVPAFADGCREVEVVQYVQGLAEVSRKIVCGGTGSGGATTGSGEPVSPIANVGTAACIAMAAALNVPIEQFCWGEPATPATVGPALMARALRQIPLPPSRLRVQPPNGRTLVNFATNFYTDREEFTRTVRLLGQQVELRITPAQFTWHFDDGERTTTTTPGAPYPKLEVTHDYLAKGGVQPRVDTTYTAVFRVGGGAWQPVPGSVTIAGEAVTLDVVEARPILVGYN